MFLKSQMLAIEQDLRFKKVEDQLISIALSPVTDFIKAADVPYHRVAYLNRFTEALSNLELTGENTWTDVTEMALVRLNLNTRAFHEYLDRKLRELCQANTEPDECIEVLSEFLKDIHANTEISPISFDPASPSGIDTHQGPHRSGRYLTRSGALKCRQPWTAAQRKTTMSNLQ